jgi:hypothetical protein
MFEVVYGSYRFEGGDAAAVRRVLAYSAFVFIVVFAAGVLFGLLLATGAERAS